MNGKERVTFAGFGVFFFAIFIIYYYFCLWGGWVDISIFTATLLTQALLFKKVPIDTQMYCVCLVTQSCLILCDPMDFSPPGSSVLGILQARILEWGAIAFSKGPFSLVNSGVLQVCFLISTVRSRDPRFNRKLLSPDNFSI